jgi:hypothetical protein
MLSNNGYSPFCSQQQVYIFVVLFQLKIIKKLLKAGHPLPSKDTDGEFRSKQRREVSRQLWYLVRNSRARHS